MRHRYVHDIIICAALTLCASGSVFARTASPDAAAPTSGEGSAGAPQTNTPLLEATSATSTSISDAKLEKFADAYMAVQDIQKEAAGQASSATASPDSSAGDLQAKMKTAVEQTGLQVEEFNQIAQQMVTDLDLRAKVAEKVQARAGRS